MAIPGNAGIAIAAALARMATPCGEIEIRIRKERVAGGGYVYTVSNTEPASPGNQP